MLGTLEQWDRDLLVFLNNLGINAFDGFWVFVTRIENWTLLYLLFTFLIFFYYPKKKGLKVFVLALATFAITLLLTDLAKVLVGRIRPNNVADLAAQLRILQQPDSYSFFSGHASTSFAITTFVIWAIRSYNKWIYLAFLWPLLFSASRIYVGVHYPSDILVGTLIGLIIAAISFRMLKLWNRKSPGSPHSQASS